jgi:serine/threonine protein kinase
MDLICQNGSIFGEILSGFCCQFVQGQFCPFRAELQERSEELSIQIFGSGEFAAPEISGCVAYDPFRADIWSLGVTFYWMATGESSWPRSSLAFRTLPLKVDVPFFKLTWGMVQPESGRQIWLAKILTDPLFAAPTWMLHPQRRLSGYGTPPPSEGSRRTGG